MFHYNAYADRGRLSRERELSLVALVPSHFSFLQSGVVYKWGSYVCKVWYGLAIVVGYIAIIRYVEGLISGIRLDG